MSAIDTNHTLAGSASAGHGFNLWAKITAWNNVRATRKSLNGLTDRELDDIGLCRGDIDHVARLG